MNDTFDPTVGPGPEENPAVPVDPINAGEIPAGPAPQFTAAEGPSRSVVLPVTICPSGSSTASAGWPVSSAFARAAAMTARSASYDGEARPGKKSPYAPMSGIGMAIQLFLMSIPVIGLILSILWACGVCRKIARRSLARAWLILLIIGILLLVAAAIVLRFCFTDEITHLFEQIFPGYTIKWG